MAVGSLGSWYTPGSLYRKWAGSNALRMNKRSVAIYDATVSAAGSIIFGQTVSASEGLSLLAAQTMQQRVTGELQKKLDSVEGFKSTALNIFA